MKFGESLSQGLVPEWKDQYVKYKDGKKLIKKIAAAKESGFSGDLTPLLDPIAAAARYDTTNGVRESQNADQTAPHGRAPNTGGTSLRTSIFSPSGKSPRLRKLQFDNEMKGFKAWLDSERTKVDAFYKSKEGEAYERFLILEDQLYQLKEHRNFTARKNKKQLQNLQQKNGINYSKVGGELAFHTRTLFSLLDRYELPSLPSFSFLKRPKKRKKKDDDIAMEDDDFDPNYYENRIRNGLQSERPDFRNSDLSSMDTETELYDTGAPAERPTPEMLRKRRRNDYEPKKPNFGVPFLFARKQLKQAVLEHYRALVLLRSYKVLNRTAFRKITKKFDKSLGTSISAQFMETLDAEAYFLTSEVLDKLINHIEELYITFFDPESADRKQSLEKLKSIAYALNNSELRQASYYGEFFTSGLFIGFALPLFILSVYTGLRNIFDGTLPEGPYLFQIYGGFFLLNLMFLLFGVNMYVFEKFKINYKFIFEFNIADALDFKQFWLWPSFSFALLSLLMWFSFHDFWRDQFPGRDWPWIFFGVMLGIFLWPFNNFYYSSRRWLQNALWRLMWSGLYPVEFRDFFIGDLLCSLTYTMGNISFFFCLYSHHWGGVLGDGGRNTCGSNKSRLMGFFSTLPSLWRFLQCFRRYADTGDWFPHFANMLKYAISSLYYVLLSVYRIETVQRNRVAFIVVATVNSLLTSAWDIIMDWSLLQSNSKHKYLRDTLFFKEPAYYYISMVLDVVLRFQWVFYAFFSHQIQQAAVTSFCIALAELLRRFIWVMFRMENEHSTNVVLFRASRDSPLPYAIGSKVEKAIKKLVKLRYQEFKLDDFNDDTESIISAASIASINSEAPPNEGPNMPQLTRRRTRLDTIVDAMNKAHIKDFQRRKKVIHDDSDDDEEEEEDEELDELAHDDLARASTSTGLYRV